MIERAGAVYVLAHAAKLGQRPFHAWAPLPPPVTLVTDCSATDEQIRPFTDAGIEVVTV
jgi:DeoR/GlpR family transcriptional regulator of sugar metabolism